MTQPVKPQAPDGETDLAARRAAIGEQLAAACRAAGRPDDAAQLIAVSKTQTVAAIEAALAAGQRLFGENRVQEAQAKFPALQRAHPDLQLHLIGPLQSNKAREAVALFDVIQTLDRTKLVDALQRAEQALGLQRRYFIQVNTGAEPQKAGVSPDGLPELLAVARSAGLSVVGLMCIPPVDAPPAPHFAFLHQLAADQGLAELSMGMSGDFAIAAELGATLVRVGSALFGARPPVALHRP